MESCEVPWIIKTLSQWEFLTCVRKFPRQNSGGRYSLWRFIVCAFCEEGIHTFHLITRGVSEPKVIKSQCSIRYVLVKSNLKRPQLVVIVSELCFSNVLFKVKFKQPCILYTRPSFKNCIRMLGINTDYPQTFLTWPQKFIVDQWVSLF